MATFVHKKMIEILSLGKPGGNCLLSNGKVVHQPEGLLSVRPENVMVLQDSYRMSG